MVPGKRCLVKNINILNDDTTYYMNSNSLKVKNWRKNIKKLIISCMGNKCQIESCGYENICGLDFHHINPNEKDFSISKIKTTPKSWSVFESELKKCILLCCRCHRELHAGLISLPQNYARYTAPILKVSKKKCSCGNNKSYKAQFCKICSYKQREKIEWPSDNLLVDLVWSKPIINLAKDLQVSDKAIQKRCKKLKIKLPPRGFWLKK